MGAAPWTIVRPSGLRPTSNKVADRLVGHHALSFSIYFYLYIGGDGVSLVIYMNIHADFCDAKSHQLLPCQRSGPLTRVSIIHMFNNCYYSVDQHHTQRQTDRLKKLRIQKMGNLFCPLFVTLIKLYILTHHHDRSIGLALRFWRNMWFPTMVL